VSKLVFRQLLTELPDGFVLEVNSAPAFNVPGIGPEVCGVDPFASRGPEVILGLKVFEVESKPENILVPDLLGRGVWAEARDGLKPAPAMPAPSNARP
jgi:hypothetical protein